MTQLYYEFPCGCKFEQKSEVIKDYDGLPPLFIDYQNIPEDCQATWALLSTGRTRGVFQLESNLGRTYTRKLQPENLEQLAALTALLRPGCVSKDTKITVIMDEYTGVKKSKRVTIEYLYKNRGKYKKILSYNEETGKFEKNDVLDIVYNGVKPVYNIKCRKYKRDKWSKNSYDLKCTDDHKLLTMTGWKELKDIQVGERIAVKKFSNGSKEAIKHVSGKSSFQAICFKNYQYKCVFCDWKEASLDVNHLEGNRFENNSADNLCFLCPNHHKMYSENLISKNEIINTREQYKIPQSEYIEWAEFLGREFVEETDVYDIMMKGPHHNFIAGNVVVHNCLGYRTEGKSMTDHFVERKHGREPITYAEERMAQYLEETYGVLVYQEQMINMAGGLANFDGKARNSLRKNVGKKLVDKLFAQREDFVKGCVSNGIEEVKANLIFDNIESAGRYSFNKCVSYDTIINKQSVGNKKTDYTVEHMFNIKNDIQYAKSCGQINLYKKYKMNGHYGYGLSLNEDGRVRQNIIKDIRYEGEKEVFLVILENGSKIETTSNHKFPTKNGEQRLDTLKVGDELLVCGNYEINKKSYGFSNQTLKDLRDKDTNNSGNHGFLTGPNNPGYTNGSFTEFVTNKLLLPDYCQICNKEHKRLETHHKNGDRTNSKLENLINLCPSCHKKEEYKQGRTKKGEKGYPVLTSKIVSIQSVGIKRVYDVEMDSPNHTFVANGNFLTCNSHSIGYGKVAYWTAYAKAHFPLAFFCAALKHAKDNDELRDLMSEISLFDISIKNPSIENLSSKFTIKEGYIQYGFGEVKSVGESAKKLIEKVVEFEKLLGKEAKDFSWYEFLVIISLDCPKTAVNNLILCGFLDHTGVSRTRQLHEYQAYSELKNNKTKLAWIVEHYKEFDNILDLLEATLLNTNNQGREKLESIIALLKNPGKSLDDNAKSLYKIETELMGVAVSADPISNKERLSNIKCLDFANGKGSKGLRLVCVVKSIQERTAKTGANAGKKYANIKLSDKTGEIECSVYTKDWLNLKNLIVEGNVVLIYGKRRDDSSLFIEKVEVL